MHNSAAAGQEPAELPMEVSGGIKVLHSSPRLHFCVVCATETADPAADAVQGSTWPDDLRTSGAKEMKAGRHRMLAHHLAREVLTRG
jgi:hypothetical protein